MTHYKPGDVILIPFPFTDLTAVKQRPAVILSSSRFNRTHQDVIIAAITSHIAQKIAHDDYLLNSHEQRSAGLPIRSIVKASKIATLDKKLIRKCLGCVPLNGTKHIIKTLLTIFRES